MVTHSHLCDMCATLVFLQYVSYNGHITCSWADCHIRLKDVKPSSTLVRLTPRIFLWRPWDISSCACGDKKKKNTDIFQEKSGHCQLSNVRK